MPILAESIKPRRDADCPAPDANGGYCRAVFATQPAAVCIYFLGTSDNGGWIVCAKEKSIG